MSKQYLDRPATPEPAAPQQVMPTPATPDVASPATESATTNSVASTPTQPDTVAQEKPATAQPAASYFGPATRPPTAKGFWRGSPAEIVFATFTALAVILAFIFSVSRISLPASAGPANTAPSTSNNAAASTGSNSQPAVAVPAHKTYDASLPAAPQGNTVDVKLVAQETLVSVAPGVAYRAWTFNGSVPGPIIHVRQGQTVNFTLVNNTGMAHSIDFHAAETPWNVNYQAVAAGKSFTFSWKANYPGVFMYHCGTPPVIEHLANGMYGAIIVDPPNGWSPAREYVLVQSEFYTRKLSDGSYGFDYNKAMAMQPDYVTFNGYANQYKDAPLTAQQGQRVRIFVVNAGPSEFSAFHVIGAIFANSYADGNPANRGVGNQTITIPPGGGAVVELTIPQAGMYPFVTHSFANATAGALGVIEIKP